MLKEIKVPLWDHAHCNGALQAQFGPAYVLPPSSVCAGAEGQDACDVRIALCLILASISLEELLQFCREMEEDLLFVKRMVSGTR